MGYQTNPPSYNPEDGQQIVYGQQQVTLDPPNYNTSNPPPVYIEETGRPVPDTLPSSRTPLRGHGELSADKFNNNQFRDVFWTFLFIAHLIGFVIVLVLAAQQYRSTPHYSNANDYNNTDSNSTSSDTTFVLTPGEFVALSTYLYICLAAVALAVVISFVYLQLIRYFARVMIIVTLVMLVMLWVTMAVIALAQGIYVYGVILLALAALNAFIFYTWRSRIPFATIVLKTVAGIIQEYPATAGFAYASLVVHFVFVCAWAAAVILAQSFSQNKFAGLFVFLLFSLYWTSQVLKNTVHVTVSGTVASWYFMKGTVGMPSSPTLGAFKRAATTSFGSICLGSLLVALLQTLKAVIQMLLRNNNQILAAIASCIIGCIDSLLQYFNKYAFTQVAIYGKTYVRAAKDTWELMKTHGIQAIVNDNLISGVLTMGSLLGAIACGVFGAIAGVVYLPHYWASLAGVCALIGFSIVILTMEVIDSAVATIYVSFAMDPEALQRSDPVLYGKFRERF